MFKKGGFFLGVLLCTTIVFAQDQTAELFRHDNPNLINLNEPAEYRGQPLVYIEGVKAPEKANNDFEELQLKLFGTKDVKSVTKNTLELSKNLPDEPTNQIENFTFQTPFHQTVQAAFIRHIPAFISIIQVLDQKNIIISEHITLMNTEEDKFWTRNLPLSHNTSAQLLGYIQNGQTYSIPEELQEDTLSFKASEPLQMGPNQLIFKYRIQNAIQQNFLDMDLTGTDIGWPIAQFKALVLFSTPQHFLENKLVFGTNKLDIPDIYTQTIDSESNTSFMINRIVPPNASIQLHIQLNQNDLPLSTSTNIYLIPLLGSLLLLLYWILFGWYEKYRAHKHNISKIKLPRSILLLAYQMDQILNEKKWQKIFEFSTKNKLDIDTLQKQKEQSEKYPQKTKITTALTTFISEMIEPIIGTSIFVISILFGLYFMENFYSNFVLILLILFSLIGLLFLYILVLKNIKKIYWQKKLIQLFQPKSLSGLTLQQVKQIYPMIILANKQEEWHVQLMQINPKLAQEIHL